VTLTASYQKVFSDDPKLGFFAQRDKFQDALDGGEVLAPAKNLDDMQQVVTNSTVDGVLAALFAVMIIIVIADASRIWVKGIRARARCRRPRCRSSSRSSTPRPGSSRRPRSAPACRRGWARDPARARRRAPLVPA
jgi:hypothetical protein